jgi:hypothetical protein
MIHESKARGFYVELLGSEVLVSAYTAACREKVADTGCPWASGIDDPEQLLRLHALVRMTRVH